MSNQLEQSDGAAFTGEGFESFPSLYFDNREIGGVTEWSDERLLDKSKEYSVFGARNDLMPRAREISRRVLSHLAFEWEQRNKERAE